MKKKRISYVNVKKLAELFCTAEEIADILEIEPEQLKADEKFQSLYRITLAHAKSKLRKLQIDQCSKGNVTMLTLLGKLYLGQKEKSDDNFKISEYDLTKLPDYFLNRIIAGENPLRVINEYELANDNNIKK